MLRFETHEVAAESVERKTFDGREYLVAPVVAVNEGILKGEFLPADEIRRVAPAFNGTPLPIGHPVEGGEFVSANRRDILENRVVGRFFETVARNRALAGEIWVDVQKSERLADERGEIFKAPMNMLEAGDPLEVSTAYWYDPANEAGKFNGESYTRTQRNLRPDHLALLPHKKGECSWEDGCGAPRETVNDARRASQDADGSPPADAMTALTAPEVAANGAPDLPEREDGARLFINMSPSDPTPDEDPENLLARGFSALLGGNDDDEQTDDDPGGSGANGSDPCGCDGPTGNCSCGGHDDGGDGSTNTMNDDELKALAESTAFDLDALEGMSDEQVEALAETVEADDDGTAQNNGDDDGDDLDKTGTNAGIVDALNSLTETVEGQSERLEALENRDPAEATKAANLRQQIETHSDLPEDAIPSDTEALEALHAEVVPSGFAGRGGSGRAANRGSVGGGADDEEVSKFKQLEAEQNEGRFGDTAEADD